MKREKENQERESREWWVSAVKEDYLNKWELRVLIQTQFEREM